MSTLSAAETKVSEELVNEINSITDVTKGVTPEYSPQAWTREGMTDEAGPSEKPPAHSRGCLAFNRIGL